MSNDHRALGGDFLDQTNRVEDLLRLAERLRLRSHRSARAHFLAGKRLSRLHLLLGVPNIALTAIVGTAIFSSLSSSYGELVVLGAGVLTALAAVLAALQTFLRHGEIAAQHRLAGVQFASLKRELDVFILEVRSHSQPIERRIDALRELSSRFGRIEESAPDVADSWYDQARTEQAGDQEGV